MLLSCGGGDVFSCFCSTADPLMRSKSSCDDRSGTFFIGFVDDGDVCS